MCDNGFIEGKEVKRGYVKPYGSPWVSIEYADADGLAIFEGCIILGDTATVEKNAQKIEQKIASMPMLLTDSSTETRGAGITGAQYRWKNRTIPYEIAADVPDTQRIFDAVAHWNEHTSIRFVEYRNQKDYVRIVRDNRGCASLVGRQGGCQTLMLGDFCTVGNIIHELGHTVGLWHEQCRTDRDQWVRIETDNVSPDKIFNFKTQIAKTIDLDTYDYGSIMHYPANAFAVTPKSTTIVPLKPLPPGVVMGQRTALSPGDIASVEALYASEGMPAPLPAAAAAPARA